MSSTLRHSLRVVVALSARASAVFAIAAATSAIGCASSASTDGAVDTQRAAIQREQVNVIDDAVLANYLSPTLLDVQDASLADVAGSLVFTPSPAMKTFLGLGAVSQAIPSFSTSFATFGNVSGAVTSASVDFSTLSARVIGSDLVISVHAKGSVHASLSYLGVGVTPDLWIDDATVTVSLAYDLVNETFFLDSNGIAATVAAHVSGCGALEWCDGIATSNLPDFAKMIEQVGAQLLPPLLAQPQVHTAVLQFYSLNANGLLGVNTAVQTPWVYEHGTGRVSGSQWTYEVSDDVIGPAPTGCGYMVGCDGSVYATCGFNAGDTYVIRRETAPGSNVFTDVPTQTVEGTTNMIVSSTGQFGSGATRFEACSENLVGSECGAIGTVTLSPTNTCYVPVCPTGYGLCDGKCVLSSKDPCLFKKPTR